MPGFTGRQIEIIRHALGLIAREGIEKLTYRNLAAELGISEPAFYRHFGSKADILSGILEYFDGLRRRLFEDARAQAADNLSALEAVVVRHLDLFQENPALAALLFPEEIRQGRRELLARVREMMSYGQQQITGIVREGIERGEIRPDLDPEQVALLISGAMRLIVGRWRLDGFAGDLKEQGARLRRTLSLLLRNPKEGG